MWQDFQQLGKSPEEVKVGLERNLKRLDRYMTDVSGKLSIPVMKISVHNFSEVLDTMHTTVLESMGLVVDTSIAQTEGINPKP
mmetsp:Transcript_15041/g.23408  ORF Transcript_15041/g.23408 Transcript_15041/m.23408 type:complete len:83 (-) Transcript_15041:6-254(-)